MNAKPKPRLLVLSSTYPRWVGDPEPGFVHELSKRLAQDFQVVALVPRSPGSRASEDMDGVRVWRYRYAPARFETLVNDGGIIGNLKAHPWKWMLVPAFLLGQMLALYRIRKKFDPQVIHAHWLLPQGVTVVLSAWLGVRMPPMLVTSHGADLFALRGRLLGRLKSFAARGAAAVTCVSNAMKDPLVALGARPDRISVMPMGVDLQTRFAPAIDVSRSDDELLFVGRLVEKKGLSHLISALPAIRRVRPRARLTVVGFGPEEQRLREQVRRLALENAVDFVGPVAQTELAMFYRRASVFVAPFVEAASGDREGLGLVVVEALGAGCPVVVSDIPAMRDVATEAAEFRRVAPGDPSAIADAVIWTLLNPGEARRAAAACRAALLSRFDWQAVARAYSTLLSSLALRHD